MFDGTVGGREMNPSLLASSSRDGVLVLVVDDDDLTTIVMPFIILTTVNNEHTSEKCTVRDGGTTKYKLWLQWL